LATPTAAVSPLATPQAAASPSATQLGEVEGLRHKVYLPVVAKPEPAPCSDTSPYSLTKEQRSRLGCPAQGFVISRRVIIQRFQNGVMVMFAKPSNRFDNAGGAVIYALANDGNAWRAEDTFIETSSNSRTWYTCESTSSQGPEKTGVPWRGFGKMWCEHPGVRRALGKALSAEQSGVSASFQSYELGRSFQVFDWRGFPGWDSRSVYVVHFASVKGDFLIGEWERK